MVEFQWEAWVAFDLGTWETYGLFFLLGSFAVASLSDLRRLSAQREFLEVWVLFVVFMFGLDAYNLGGEVSAAFIVKWALIVVLSILSWHRVGFVFRLAPADVWACAAAASLLSPFFVALFWVLLKVSAAIEKPILPRQQNAYPFLPVVTTATVLVLVVAWYLGPWLETVVA